MVKVCMDLGGSVEQMELLNLVSGGELTISSGAITVTNSVHTVDTEADAVTDDLNTISGGSAGDVILLARASAARAVVLKHNAGNIKTPSGTDHELTALGFVILKHDGSNWHLQSGNGSGYMLNKLACLTVATENITLNDEQVINGVNCSEDARVFLAGQTDETENGPWIVKAEDPYYPSSGDWIRPADFQDGFSVSGHAFYIEQGTEYSNSVWMITNGYGEDIVGTDDLNAVNLGAGTASGFDIVSLPEDNTNTSADYLTKYDGANNKIKRNDLLNPGFKTLTDAATVTINLADPERTFAVVLGGNRTLAIVNASVGDEFWVKLIQDGTGSRTVTWFSTINWQGGSAPTLTTTADKADYFLFKCRAVNTFDCLIQTLDLGTTSGDTIALSTDIIYNWSMDETTGARVDDVYGQELTSAALPGYDTGKNGNAASFNGSSQYMTMSANSGDPLDFGDSDFSVRIWVKLNTVDSDQVIIFGPNFTIFFETDDDTIRFFVVSPSNEQNEVSWSPAVSDSTWYMIVATHDSVNNLIKVSVNGGDYQTAAHIGGVKNFTSGTAYIGTLANISSYLDGVLDAITVWGKALSQAEVNELYNAGSGKFYPFA